ncbi:MAG: hypothetical protein U0930_25160 [Pirellulales bacterium]
MITRKRVRSILATLIAGSATWFGMSKVSSMLGDESTFTGAVLLVATLSLYLLTIRKRTVSSRLGKVSAWLQLHMYAGIFASVVFAMHIRWPIEGPFELCLAACFIFIAVSGIVLGIMSRLTPAKLAALKQDYAIEQIPQLQLAVARDAHDVAMSSTRLGEGATLSEYYQRRLLPYFQTPRGQLYRLIPTGSKRRQLLRELEDLDRYLAGEGLKHRRRLSAMVQSKDDLDFHFALQSRLRFLYAAHFALTWTMLILIGVHVVLVLRFSGAIL